MANLIINLAQLQDKIKRDPTGYKVGVNFFEFFFDLKYAKLTHFKRMSSMLNFSATKQP